MSFSSRGAANSPIPRWMVLVGGQSVLECRVEKIRGAWPLPVLGKGSCHTRLGQSSPVTRLSSALLWFEQVILRRWLPFLPRAATPGPQADLLDGWEWGRIGIPTPCGARSEHYGNLDRVRGTETAGPGLRVFPKTIEKRSLPFASGNYLDPPIELDCGGATFRFPAVDALTTGELAT